jgi:hypothetical protein
MFPSGFNDMKLHLKQVLFSVEFISRWHIFVRGQRDVISVLIDISESIFGRR